MHPSPEQEDQFILHLGRALISWQRVESATYGIFCAFMEGANKKLTSVIFHHIQSFESRVSLLDKCAHFAISDSALEIRWRGKKGSKENSLRVRLEKQMALRNRIVHFSYKTGVDKSGPFVAVGPSIMDASYAINDRWKSPDYKIDLAGLQAAERSFEKLADDLGQFRADFESIAK